MFLENTFVSYEYKYEYSKNFTKHQWNAAYRYMIDWLNDFNGMSTYFRLLYTKKFVNRVYYAWYLNFLYCCFLWDCLCYPVFLSNTNKLNTVVWFQVFLF